MSKCKELFNNQIFTNEKNSNILDVDIKHYNECGFCKDNSEELNVPWSIYSLWLFLLQQMENKEWGGVLSIKDKTVIEFKIPEQEVTSTECEFKEELGGEGIIHSHHSMGAFHSGQDDEHARNLYDYSIVISHQGIISTKRKKLPCGGFGYTDVKIKVIDLPSNIDLNKIKEKTYNNFIADSIHNKEGKGECNSCLKEKEGLEYHYIDENLVQLCKECEKKYIKNEKEEEFICSMCMLDFPIAEQQKYLGNVICQECYYDLNG